MSQTDLVDRVDALRAQGRTVAAACRALGVSTTTYYRRRRRFPADDAALDLPPAPPAFSAPPLFAQARDWRAFADAELDDAAVWRLDSGARAARARLFSARPDGAAAAKRRVLRLRGPWWRAACAVTPVRVAIQSAARLTASVMADPAGGLRQTLAAAALAALLSLGGVWLTLAAAEPRAWSLIDAPTTAALVAGPAAQSGSAKGF